MIEEFAMQGTSTTSTASSQQLSGLPLDGSVVKLRGLPFRASVEDVLKFFASFAELSSGNIYFKRHPDGRPSGEVGAELFGYLVWGLWRDALAVHASLCFVSTPSLLGCCFLCLRASCLPYALPESAPCR